MDGFEGIMPSEILQAGKDKILFGITYIMESKNKTKLLEQEIRLTVTKGEG